MAVKPIPDGFQQLIPYLVAPRVPQLIEFLKQSFGATEGRISKRPDGVIMHAQLRIGDSAVMMAEANEQFPPLPCALYLYVQDTDAAYERAIKAGGTSLMKPCDQFYGDRNAGVKDPSGNQWWIATHIEDVSDEELDRRAQAQGRK